MRALPAAETTTAPRSVTESIEDFLDDNEVFADMLARASDASLAESYVATSLQISALIASGFAIQSVLRIRSEETSGYAEMVLTTRVSRRQWAASQLAVTAVGTAIVLLAMGAGLGITAAVVTGDADLAWRTTAAALVEFPAIAVLVGATLALIGLRPTWSMLGWGLLALAFVVTMLGELIGLPSAISALSPFHHVPLVPAVALEPVPLLALVAVAAGLGVAGAGALTRRDLG